MPPILPPRDVPVPNYTDADLRNFRRQHMRWFLWSRCLDCMGCRCTEQRMRNIMTAEAPRDLHGYEWMMRPPSGAARGAEGAARGS